MEVLNHLRTLTTLVIGFQSPFAHFITLSMKKIIQSFIDDTRIKNLRDFKFLFFINFN